MTQIKDPCPICGQETEGLKLQPYEKELKPCPFCGNPYIGLFVVPAECGVNFIVGCYKCGATTRYAMSHREAIELWNNRDFTITDNAGFNATARKMRNLLEDFCNVYSWKSRAKSDNDDMLLNQALTVEVAAVNMAKELLACIDDKENE